VFSIKRCREILGPNAPVEDQEIEQLRDQIYGLADIIAETLLSRTKSQAAIELADERTRDYNDYSVALRMLSEDERDDVEERAAIIEFEAEADRETAEKRAIVAVLRRTSPERGTK
jgi:hypothetical protein